MMRRIEEQIRAEHEIATEDFPRDRAVLEDADAENTMIITIGDRQNLLDTLDRVANGEFDNPDYEKVRLGFLGERPQPSEAIAGLDMEKAMDVAKIYDADRVPEWIMRSMENKRQGAVTIGKNIYLRRQFNRTNPEHWALLAHELVHVAQRF
ncbi:MAG: DUF4157 domain-containing protein [Deltaproteobacteria bacterium]|nr:DUF4157 domain-containing protein [Deltaproteobacteria bacterium]